jgi:ATP/maltotriose-dependent transcriptional regulator MalT
MSTTSERTLGSLAPSGRVTGGTERFVGRADELASLERILEGLDRGDPGAIELTGEPGIGKTRLLKELVVGAEARGHLVLSGSASELEHDLPFSVFIDALDEYVAGLEPERLAALGREVQAELAHVFPMLPAPTRGRGAVPHHERSRSHRAVRGLLELLAASTPLVLVLDDVHWADAASAELLGALLRRPPGAVVLVALAVRPHHVPERLAAALERAHRDGFLTRMELGPLSFSEACGLLGEGVEAPEAATLYEESGGNPFYLQQLAWALDRPAGTASIATGLTSSVGVPSAVAASLTEELALLSEPTRLVLEGAAVAGDPFEPELAAAAAATSETAAMDAIDRLLRFDLVRPTDVPRRFRFRHPLLRRAVYEATPGAWRLGAHERCAEALATRGATWARRAHHVERSAQEGDLGAVAILRQAGQEAAGLAPASAARWFGAALRLLPQTAPSADKVELLLARASSLAATGQFAEARTDLLDGIGIATRGAEAWRVRVTTACAAVEHLLGLQKEAHRHLSTALAALGDVGSAQAVELMIELTVDGFYAGDLDAMRSWSERAVATATTMGEPSSLASALAVRAWAGAFAGDGAAAQAHCDEATALVDDLPDEALARRLETLSYLAGADLYLDRFSAATRHAQRALQVGRAAGRGDFFPDVVAILGGSLWVQGRPMEAGELFDGAVEAARLDGNVQSLAWSLFNRSFAALVAGDLDVALPTAEESFELEADMEPSPLSALAAAVLAAGLLEAGQAERSVELLLGYAGGEELRLIGGGWRARFLEVLTRALLATGRRDDAERASAAAQACADEVALRSADAMAGLAAAALALDAGQPAAAAQRALEAATALEAVAARFDAARAREVAGTAFARAGDRDRAELELELVAAAYGSFGSFRYRDRTERELRKLGRHIHRRTNRGRSGGSGVDALTERELQVARLVVDRRTNPEIASELFLSLKTVETHLRNIFHKMDVTTRADLARAVERADTAASAPPEPARGR